MQAIRELIVHFVEVMITDTFRKSFSVLALKVGYFLEWVIKVDIPVVKRIYEVAKKNADTGFKYFNSYQYLLPMLSSTARRSSSTWTITSPSPFDGHVFLQNTSLVNNNITITQFSCSRTYTPGRLAGCTVQNIMKTWIALARATEI